MKATYKFLLIFFLSFPALGQKMSSKAVNKSFPQENIFVDYNSSIKFPGEYLYYKVYVINKETGKLSDMSKIAYVKMVNDQGGSIFTHKIKLDSGTGYADFFVPTDIASGTYKLIAFTEGMFNVSDTNYFNSTIFIINPYTTKHENSFIRSEQPVGNQVDKLNRMKEFPENGILKLPKGKVYKKREEVSLILDSLKLKEGNYSLSVNKKNSFGFGEEINILNYTTTYHQKSHSENSPKRAFLPELRGDLFKGTISINDEKLKVENRDLAISVPGDNFFLKISHTNNQGDFYFSLDKAQSIDHLYVQVLGENEQKFDIKLDTIPNFDYSSLEFPKLTITPSMEKEIVSRSIQNQVENSYYSVKPDTLKILKNDEPFFGSKNVEEYVLDDYDRFPTVKETFIEIITAAKIRKDTANKNVFEVYPKNDIIKFNSSALILVDGLYIQDTDVLMNYSANKIAKIDVVRDKYYFGSKFFGGIISIVTKEKDFVEAYKKPYLKKFDIIPVQATKNYYEVNYSKQELQRIPDFRRQLLWKPYVNRPKTIGFFTSDLEGVFVITLQGMDKEGRKVFSQREFTVE